MTINISRFTNLPDCSGYNVLLYFLEGIIIFTRTWASNREKGLKTKHFPHCTMSAFTRSSSCCGPCPHRVSAPYSCLVYCCACFFFWGYESKHLFITHRAAKPDQTKPAEPEFIRLRTERWLKGPYSSLDDWSNANTGDMIEMQV